MKEGNGNGTRVEEENNCDKWRASQLSYVLLHNFPMHHILEAFFLETQSYTESKGKSLYPCRPGANKRFFSPLNPPPTHVFFLRLEPPRERSSKLGHGILEEVEEGAVVTLPIKVFEIHAQLCCLSASGTLLINLVRAVYVYGFDGRCSTLHWCSITPSSVLGARHSQQSLWIMGRRPTFSRCRK